MAGAQPLGVVAGALAVARFAPGRSRRSLILAGGVVAGVGVSGIVTLSAFPLLFVSAALAGVGGIVATSSGAALLADATVAADRPARFGQQIALGTMAAFAASASAGAVAAPVAGLLGTAPGDALTLRVLVAFGGIAAAASALPILLLRATPVATRSLEAPQRRDLLGRFGLVEFIFGFGAWSFLPFTNLFFADRFGVPFATLGLLLGGIAAAGSSGALAHGPLVARRVGVIPGIVLVEVLSVPFALVAAATADVAVAIVSLAARAGLMYGASASSNAYSMSSFTPAERAGANAFFALAWNAGAAAGAAASGAVRVRLGPAGFTANLLTLGAAYLVAAALTYAFFHAREPRGDVGATQFAAPHSTG